MKRSDVFCLNIQNAYRDADIVRTRDESVLSGLDVVIDVGGKYDPGMIHFLRYSRTQKYKFQQIVGLLDR